MFFWSTLHYVIPSSCRPFLIIFFSLLYILYIYVHIRPYYFFSLQCYMFIRIKFIGMELILHYTMVIAKIKEMPTCHKLSRFVKCRWRLGASWRYKNKILSYYLWWFFMTSRHKWIRTDTWRQKNFYFKQHFSSPHRRLFCNKHENACFISCIEL